MLTSFTKKTILPFCVVFFLNPLFAQDSFVPNDLIESNGTLITELNNRYVVTSTGINTKLSEIGATFFRDKYIIYSSRNTGAIGAGKDSNTNMPYANLYCVSVDKNANLSKPYFFATSLNKKGNEGGLTFSANQNTVYYTNSTTTNPKNYQLYKATFDPDCHCKYMWKDEGMIVLSNDNYSIENPCTSPDGKLLYFASNKPGGFGGYDLYVATIDEKGNPVDPINLGSAINTDKDEKFPYVSPTKQIYFSSNGLPGYGGHDVFVSKIKKNGFSLPINLGGNLNTAADEVAFVLASSTQGFVSSNKNQGIGSYDIYRFECQINKNLFKGKVVEKESKIALAKVIVRLINDEGESIANQVTDENGNYNFEVTPLEKYSVVANKEGYNEFSEPVIATIGERNFTVEMMQSKAVVTETAIRIENIYFEFNKTTIKKESTLSLNKIVEVLSNNPEMIIQINAYTDARGNDTYNFQLSEKRAVAAKNYLLSKGIDQKRIIAKGFGETQSLSNCIENCTEAEFDLDRRIEFVIIK